MQFYSLLQPHTHVNCDIDGIVERIFEAVQDALNPRPTQLQPQPEIARYGEATAHENLSVIRIPVRTACTATRQRLRTLCSGARLHISRNISALFGTCKVQDKAG